MSTKIIAVMAGLIVAGAPAYGQDAAKGDPAQGTGPLPPNVAPLPTPICTDRPTKASVACTVPAGGIQIETDAVNWERSVMDGARVDTVFYTNPTLKYGLGTRTDVELNIVPYETVTTRVDGHTERIGGVGDLYLRVKRRLTADKAKTQVSVIPFIKAPTARGGIGNRQWEAGVAGAINVPLPAGVTLAVGPEIDALANQSGSGRHANVVTFVNVSHSLVKDANVFAEFWNSHDFDPAGTRHQYSADFAATYQLSKTLQLDAGANIGLNSETPRHQIYMGASTRF